MSLASGAFITVCHPVERRLQEIPRQLVCCVILASPPFPILRRVPRKEASSDLILVMQVFSLLRVSLRRSPRKVLICSFSSSAKPWLPPTPTIQSSAYLRYFILMKLGSSVCID